MPTRRHTTSHTRSQPAPRPRRDLLPSTHRHHTDAARLTAANRRPSRPRTGTVVPTGQRARLADTHAHPATPLARESGRCA